MTSGVSISLHEISGKKEPVGFVNVLSGPLHSRFLYTGRLLEGVHLLEVPIAVI